MHVRLLPSFWLGNGSGYFKSTLSSQLKPSSMPNSPVTGLTNMKESIGLFKNIPTSRIILASLILKACQVPLLTNYIAPWYVKRSSEHPGLFSPFSWIAKHSFYSHFCAGSTREEITKCVSVLSESSVGAIFDPAMEEDCPEVLRFPSDKYLPMLITSNSSAFEIQKMEQRRAQIFSIIDAAADAPSDAPRSFLALKMTCMVPPGLLYMLTVALNEIPGSRMELFENDPHFILDSYFDILVSRRLISAAHPTEAAALHLSLTRAIEFCKTVFNYASSKSIPIMVDAEQSYFQPAIHFLTLGILRGGIPAVNDSRQGEVYATYQMYLKDGLVTLMQDFEFCKKHKIPFSVKIVRGAYMQSESERASRLNECSPINDTIEMTHNGYRKAIQFLTEHADDPVVRGVFFATHNPESVQEILNFAKSKNLKKIMIGQLFGMADWLTFSIAASGQAQAYKYLPIGTLQEVLPYLLRRAQENSSFIERSNQERSLLLSVLWRRFVQF